jgi:hypothetical protein
VHAPAAPRDDPHEPPLPWVLDPGGGVFSPKATSLCVQSLNYVPSDPALLVSQAQEDRDPGKFWDVS